MIVVSLAGAKNYKRDNTNQYSFFVLGQKRTGICCFTNGMPVSNLPWLIFVSRWAPSYHLLANQGSPAALYAPWDFQVWICSPRMTIYELDWPKDILDRTLSRDDESGRARDVVQCLSASEQTLLHCPILARFLSSTFRQRLLRLSCQSTSNMSHTRSEYSLNVTIRPVVFLLNHLLSCFRWFGTIHRFWFHSLSIDGVCSNLWMVLPSHSFVLDAPWMKISQLSWRTRVGCCPSPFMHWWFHRWLNLHSSDPWSFGPYFSYFQPSFVM